MMRVPTPGAEIALDIRGPEGAPPVVLLPALGTTRTLFDPLLPALVGRWRVIACDLRGHGASPPVFGPWTIADLADDLLAVLDALGIERAVLAGVSLGAMAALDCAARYPGRVAGLVLASTALHLSSAESWHETAARVREGGMAAVAERVMRLWFGAADAAEEAVDRARADLLTTAPETYAQACEALAALDHRALAGTVGASALVLAGGRDRATPPADALALAQALPEAQAVILPKAGHLPLASCPDAVAAHLTAFLKRLAAKGDPREGGAGATLAAGLAHRKSVLGAEHVERSLAKAGAFSRPWQDFITRMAWGEVWGDPTLPWKTRSFITLAMMVALHREEEFKLHVRPALRNGVTADELRALLIQTSIYAGVPAANAGFRWVREVLGEEWEGREPS